MEHVPFTEWVSPIAAEDLSTPVLSYNTPRAWGKALGYVRATGANGALELWRYRKGEHRRVTEGRNVRSALYGYGAPAWAPLGKELAVVLTTDRPMACVVNRDGEVVREIPLSGVAQGYPARWSEQEFAYIADFGPTMGRAIIVAHHASGISRVVYTTQEFLSDLTIDINEGRVFWLSWPTNTMPWDGAVLQSSPRSYVGLKPERVSGVLGAAAAVPLATTGTLTFSTESGDRFVPVRHRSGATERAEFFPGEARSDWSFGWRWTAHLDEATAHVALRGSTTSLVLWRHDGTLEEVSNSPVAIVEIAGRGDKIYVTGSDGEDATSLWQYSVSKHEWKVITRQELPERARTSLSVSEERRTDSGVPFVFYEPVSANFQAGPHDRPGLVLDVHGGPTAFSSRRTKLSTQLLTSSGFAVASVNYRGSTGYGKEYRRALDRHYGGYDVLDVLAVARWLVERGEVNPGRVFVRGGSSGGMTALLCGSDPLINGVIAHYPVTDVEQLSSVTHEFEASYLATLIGPLPEDVEHYTRVSPRSQSVHPRRILITQGARDEIVPASATREYVEFLRTQHVAVTYLEFDDEGHGYRSPEAISQTAFAELDFLRA